MPDKINIGKQKHGDYLITQGPESLPDNYGSPYRGSTYTDASQGYADNIAKMHKLNPPIKTDGTYYPTGVSGGNMIPVTKPYYPEKPVGVIGGTWETLNPINTGGGGMHIDGGSRPLPQAPTKPPSGETLPYYPDGTKGGYLFETKPFIDGPYIQNPAYPGGRSGVAPTVYNPTIETGPENKRYYPEKNSPEMMQRMLDEYLSKNPKVPDFKSETPTNLGGAIGPVTRPFVTGTYYGNPSEDAKRKAEFESLEYYGRMRKADPVTKAAMENEMLQKKASVTPSEKQKFNDNLNQLITAKKIKNGGRIEAADNQIRKRIQPGYGTAEYWRELRGMNPVDGAVYELGALQNEPVLTEEEKKRRKRHEDALQQAVKSGKVNKNQKNFVDEYFGNYSSDRFYR